MAAVDERLGVIAKPEVKPYREVRRGYTFFAEGDVLFAKITPCMQNGKHAVARRLLDGLGFGTTEFHVLRPGDLITSDWLHLYLRQPTILQAAGREFTGTVGQQRVPEEFLSSLEIPLPPLPEQHRIVDILRAQMVAVQKAEVAADEQLGAARAVSRSCLSRAFEGPQANGWPRLRLGDVGHITSGVTLGRKLPASQTRRVPYLRVANVKDGHLDLSTVRETEATEDEITSLRLRFGDLLLTEGGDADKLGRGTFWDEQMPVCIHQNHIFRVRFDLDRFVPQFVSYQIASPYGKKYFLAHAKQTTGIATINQRVLANFPLMAPPLETQRSVVGTLTAELDRTEQVIEESGGQVQLLQKLPALLLRRAFDGSL
jgi:type I restriction enzyme S subunit